jgi:hypothetical protein
MHRVRRLLGQIQPQGNQPQTFPDFSAYTRNHLESIRQGKFHSGSHERSERPKFCLEGVGVECSLRRD